MYVYGVLAATYETALNERLDVQSAVDFRLRCGLNGEIAALSVSTAMDGFCDCWLMDLDFSVDIDAPESFYCCHQCKG